MAAGPALHCEKTSALRKGDESLLTASQARKRPLGVTVETTDPNTGWGEHL